MSLRVIDAASYQGNMPQKNMDFDAADCRAKRTPVPYSADSLRHN